MSELNEMERAVLGQLLAGDVPALSVLREQAAHCLVTSRTFTGVGFFTDLMVAEGIPSASTVQKAIRFGDVVAAAPGVEAGLGFLLYVDDGRITALEGYTYGESWPDGLEIASMAYTSEPRDLSVFR